MTRTPKKLLSSSFFLLATLFVILLVVFFLYALKVQRGFFVTIGITQLFVIAILVFLQNVYLKNRAQSDLEKQDYVEKTNLLQVEIDKERQALQAYQNKIVNYSQLKDLTEHLSLCLTLADTSNALSEEVSKLFGSEDVTTILYLFHSKTGELGILSSQKGQMRVNLKSKKGDIFDGWLAKTVETLLILDAKSDFRFSFVKVVFE